MSPKQKLIALFILLIVILIPLGIAIGFSLKDQLEEKVDKDETPATIQDEEPQISTTIPDTGQTHCFNDSQSIICPTSGGEFYGQDAQYQGNVSSYTNNGDGTITDNVTGLMWQKDPGDKIYYSEAVDGAESFDLAGYTDWRAPTIKELYSLMDFQGTDPSADASEEDITPFIDTDYFDFQYGDTQTGDRLIDSQWVTSTVYKSTTMNDQECFFGVNFADGRIKCYPTSSGKKYFAIYVRGDSYGENDFANNNDGTVSDKSTGLVWQQTDNGTPILWKNALPYCESLELADQTDWRLPNVKELQSIVDYDRSPNITNSPAIHPVFQSTIIKNEADQDDYGFYWTSTTHITYPSHGDNAVYISFGRALGYMEKFGGWVDVHGAGAQRSDPKTGDSDDYPTGHGPQGDARRIINYVRCVRGGNATPADGDAPIANSSSSDTKPNEPPAEAINACSSKKSGDDCIFKAPDGTITGTCKQIGSDLACVP